MPIQRGRCAFTAACIYAGPRFRLRGTNQTVCEPHARTIALGLTIGGREGGELAIRMPNLRRQTEAASERQYMGAWSWRSPKSKGQG